MSDKYILTSMTNQIEVDLSAKSDFDALVESLSKLGWVVSKTDKPKKESPPVNTELKPPTIFEFYKNNKEVDEDFDDEFYAKRYPSLKDFYQPKCKDSDISDRKRLFYHYEFYGKNGKFMKNPKEIPEEVPINTIDNSIIIYGTKTTPNKVFDFCRDKK